MKTFRSVMKTLKAVPCSHDPSRASQWEAYPIRRGNPGIEASRSQRENAEEGKAKLEWLGTDELVGRRRR